MMLFPVFLVLHVVFTIGIALILATATAFFRDVRHLLEVALSVLFWTTPIVYELGRCPTASAAADAAEPDVAVRGRLSEDSSTTGSGRMPTVWAGCACAYAVGAFVVGVALFLPSKIVSRSSSSDAVIEAQGVSKQFLLRHNASVELKVRFLGLLQPEHRQSIEEFWALKNVSRSGSNAARRSV